MGREPPLSLSEPAGSVARIAAIRIEPATSSRFDDAQHALSGGGDGRSCQCQWWTITNAEWQRSDSEERRALLRDELTDATPPALIAYVDDEPAGWVRVGPRIRQVRLGRTKNLTAASQLPWDDPDVWAVSCFVVRNEHRRGGLNAQLLDAAIDFARAHGARMLEAYPIDPHAAARTKRASELFHGVVSTFRDAGFTEVGRPRPDLAVMTLPL